MYGVGACVEMEVLAAAREIIRLESQSKLAEAGATPDRGPAAAGDSWRALLHHRW